MAKSQTIRKRSRSAGRAPQIPGRVRRVIKRPTRLSVPLRRPARAATIAAAGLITTGVARGVAFRAGRQTRTASFYSSLSYTRPASFASWEDEISDLLERIGALQEAALLPSVGQDMDEINVLIGRLPAVLQQVRQRGYVHGAHLEERVAGLEERWDLLCERVGDTLYQQQTQLVESANRLLDTVDRLYEPGASRSLVDNCWAGVAALQSRIEAAHGSVAGMYDDLAQELEHVEEGLERVEWMLGQVEGASFRLLEGEALVRAAGAQWIRQGADEGPIGILYLTDQRVLFEQKQEVTTEKFLFIKLKKELVQEFMLEAPVQSLIKAKPGQERDGLLRTTKIEILDLEFDHTASLSFARFRLLKDSAESWKGTLGLVRSGEIDGARTEEAATEAKMLDQARSDLPTNCPNCSAPLDAQLLRGETSVVCGFCGTAIQV